MKNSNTLYYSRTMCALLLGFVIMSTVLYGCSGKPQATITKQPIKPQFTITEMEVSFVFGTQKPTEKNSEAWESWMKQNIDIYINTDNDIITIMCPLPKKSDFIKINK